MAFTQFGSELDKATQAQLTRGERMVEILKQDQYQPMSLAHQVAILYVAGQGHLDDVPREQVKRFEVVFHQFLDERYPDVIHEIAKSNALADAIAKRLDEAVAACKQLFVSLNQQTVVAATAA